MASNVNSGCSYKGCHNNPPNEATGKVEVCTVMPKKLPEPANMLIGWTKDGCSTFHLKCWDILTKAARATKKNKGPLSLQITEKKMIKEAIKTMEFHDSLETLKREGKRIANLIMTSKHCVCFTGAGISTSAGIGDYRGKQGKWTEEDRNLVEIPSEESEGVEPPSKRFRRQSSNITEDGSDEEMESDGVPYEDLRPTYTHEALCHLVSQGCIKHIISQNGDGLHELSGIEASKLSELHGNVFVERCEKCGTRYNRPYYVLDDTCSLYYEEIEDNGKTDIKKPKHAKQCEFCKLSHRTGRKCSKKGCKGYLIDSIINFRDHLEDAIIDKAFKEAGECDLMLALGTTLMVTPANEVIQLGKEPQRLVICNRQKTDFDSLCMKTEPSTNQQLGSRVFGDCDKLMKEVMTNILAKPMLEKWESGREERMEQYSEQRKQEN